jgi:hypothetical protein
MCAPTSFPQVPAARFRFQTFERAAPGPRDGRQRGACVDDCNRSTQATDLDHPALDRIWTALSNAIQNENAQNKSFPVRRYLF